MGFELSFVWNQQLARAVWVPAKSSTANQEELPLLGGYHTRSVRGLKPKAKTTSFKRHFETVHLG